MKAVATPPEARKWLGDEDMGWCPNCHSNALVLGEPQWDGIHYPIECQVCGCDGTLEKTAEGKWKFVIQENGGWVRTTPLTYSFSLASGQIPNNLSPCVCCAG